MELDHGDFVDWSHGCVASRRYVVSSWLWCEDVTTIVVVLLGSAVRLQLSVSGFLFGQFYLLSVIVEPLARRRSGRAGPAFPAFECRVQSAEEVLLYFTSAQVALVGLKRLR